MTTEHAEFQRLRFSILGPIRVQNNDRELDLGPRQQRLILALLLVNAGKPVGTREFINLLWWEKPPPSSAVNIVHRSIGALRRLFEPHIRIRSPGRWLLLDAAGYRMLVDPESLDLLAFRKWAEEARAAAAAGNPRLAMTSYLKAIELSQGPCAGAADLMVEHVTPFDAVDHEYADLVCEAADFSLRSDDPRSILGILRRVAEQRPFDEAMQARLLLTLSAVGQQAGAIALYQQIRQRLAAELGVDPGHELQSAYQSILIQQNTYSGGESRNTHRAAVITDAASNSAPNIGAHGKRSAHTTHIVVGSDDIGPNGHVRSSKYIDYVTHARWVALAEAGLSIKKFTSAGIGPVDLDVSLQFKHELTLGDEVDIVTYFEYPSPKIVRLVQYLILHPDEVMAARVTSVTGLMDLKKRKLIENAAEVWAAFLQDLSLVDLVGPD